MEMIRGNLETFETDMNFDYVSTFNSLDHVDDLTKSNKRFTNCLKDGQKMIPKIKQRKEELLKIRKETAKQIQIQKENKQKYRNISNGADKPIWDLLFQHQSQC